MKKMLAWMMALAMLLALAGCGGAGSNTSSAAPQASPAEGGGAPSTEAPAAPASEDVIVLKLGHVNSEQTNYHAGFVKFAEEVERLTEGRVTVEVYANAQLGNERDMFEGLQLGTIDIGAVVSSVMTNFVPECMALDAPFMFKDVPHAIRVIDGQVGQTIDAKLATQGFNNLGWFFTGFRQIFSTREMPDLASMSGMKIRTMESDVHIDTFNALGMIATPMPYGELFTALQQGTVDAAENAIDNVLSQKFYEVTKNIAYTNHVFTFIGLGISQNALAKVPAELHDALFEAGKNAADYQRQLMVEANQSAEQALKDVGVTFYQPERQPFVDAIQGVYEKYGSSFDQDIVNEIKRLETEES